MAANLIDHMQSPRNRGLLEDSDAVGLAGSPGRSPYIVLYLRIDSGTVSEAKYQSEGCGPTIASGSVLTELIIGRKLDECRQLTPDGAICHNILEFHARVLATWLVRSPHDEIGAATESITSPRNHQFDQL